MNKIVYVFQGYKDNNLYRISKGKIIKTKGTKGILNKGMMVDVIKGHIIASNFTQDLVWRYPTGQPISSIIYYNFGNLDDHIYDTLEELIQNHFDVLLKH